jgi:serine/threonine protein kinase
MSIDTGTDRLSVLPISANLKDVVVLGAGGFATVFRAYDTVLDRLVAIKVLNPSRDTNAAGRLIREAQAMVRIDHPSVVKIYSLGIASDKSPYIVMEYVKGRTLADELAEKGRFSVEHARGVFEKILQGVAEIHRHGFIHRDLTASNCIITAESGAVKILDFGLVKVLSAESIFSNESLTGPGFVCGTVAYLSPEGCVKDGILDKRSDVYSLGCLLYQMVTGKVPFLGSSDVECMLQHLKQSPEPVCKSLDGVVYPKLESVISKAMAKRPEDRYQTIEEFQQDLSDLTNCAPLSGNQPRTANGSKSVRLSLALRLTIVVAIGACLMVALFNGRETNSNSTESTVIALEHEQRELGNELFENQKAVVAGRATDRHQLTMSELKKRLFDVSLKIVQLRSKLLMEASPSNRARAKAVVFQSYRLLLPLCDTTEKRAVALTDFSFIAKCDPKSERMEKDVARLLQRQINAAIMEHRTVDALLWYRQLRQLDCKLPKDEEKEMAQALFGYAVELGNFEYSLHLATELIRLEPAGFDSNVIILRLLDICYQRSSHVEAQKYYERVQNLFLTSPVHHSKGRAECFFRLSQAWFRPVVKDRSMLKDAERAGLLARGVKDEFAFLKLQHDEMYSESWLVIAETSAVLGKPEQAQSAYERAALAFEERGDSANAVFNLLQSALTGCVSQQAVPRSMKVLEKAQAILTASGQIPFRSNLVSRLYEVRYRIACFAHPSKPLLAAEIAAEGIKGLSQNGDWENKASFCLFRAHALRLAGKCKESKLSVQEGINCLVHSGLLKPGSEKLQLRRPNVASNEDGKGLDCVVLCRLVEALTVSGELDTATALLDRMPLETNRAEFGSQIAHAYFLLAYGYQNPSKGIAAVEKALQWDQASTPESLLDNCELYLRYGDKVQFEKYVKMLQDAIAAVAKTDKGRATAASNKFASTMMKHKGKF